MNNFIIYDTLFEVMRDNRARMTRCVDMQGIWFQGLLINPNLGEWARDLLGILKRTDHDLFILLPIREAELLVAHNIDNIATQNFAMTIREMLTNAYKDEADYIMLKVGPWK